MENALVHISDDSKVLTCLLRNKSKDGLLIDVSH